MISKKPVADQQTNGQNSPKIGKIDQPSQFCPGLETKISLGWFKLFLQGSSKGKQFEVLTKFSLCLHVSPHPLTLYFQTNSKQTPDS